MNVRELIDALKKYPPDMEVVMPETTDGDQEYVPVLQVFCEDATSVVTLSDQIVAMIEVHPFGSCGGACSACSDKPG